MHEITTQNGKKSMTIIFTDMTDKELLSIVSKVRKQAFDLLHVVNKNTKETLYMYSK